MKNIWLIIVLIGAFTYCTTKENKGNEDAKTSAQADTVFAKISVDQFKKADIKLGGFIDTVLNDEVKANGLIDVPPQNLASINAPMGGYVRKTTVLPGEHVHKGDILAILEHQDYIQLQQDYLQALSRLELVRKEYDRQKELFDENVSSTKKLQISNADNTSAMALVNALEEKIKLLGIDTKKLKTGYITPRISIRAPINGNVKSVNVSLGKFVNPTDVMYEIIDNSHQHLELRVFEKDILKVAEGQKIIFTVPSLGENKFTGKVYLVGKNFDNTTRTILVHGHLDSEDKKRLLPGMYVNAEILVDEKKVKVLPEDALVMANENHYIYIFEKEDQAHVTFRKVAVKTGLSKGGLVEVIANDSLYKNKKIVLNGAYFINGEMNKTDE